MIEIVGRYSGSANGVARAFDTSLAYFARDDRALEPYTPNPNPIPPGNLAAITAGQIPESDVRRFASFKEWLRDVVAEGDMSLRGIGRATPVDHTAVSRFLSDNQDEDRDREPSIKTLATLVEISGRSEEEVYHMIMTFVPEEIRRKFDSMPSQKGPILKGSSSTQLIGYIDRVRLNDRDLGGITGVDHSTISRLRTFEGRKPTARVFARLAFGVGMTLFEVRKYLKTVAAEKAGKEILEEEDVEDPTLPIVIHPAIARLQARYLSEAEHGEERVA